MHTMLDPVRVVADGRMIDEYDGPDEAVTAMLEHWWEEEEGQCLLLTAGNRVIATMLSGPAVATGTTIVGTVYVTGAYGSFRQYRVCYLLDGNGCYIRTDVTRI